MDKTEGSAHSRERPRSKRRRVGVGRDGTVGGARDDAAKNRETNGRGRCVFFPSTAQHKFRLFCLDVRASSSENRDENFRRRATRIS